MWKQRLGEGFFGQREVNKVDVDKWSAHVGLGDLGKQVAQIWAAHLNTIGTMEKSLGWRPAHGLESWQDSFEWELTAALEGSKTVTGKLNAAIGQGWNYIDT